MVSLMPAKAEPARFQPPNVDVPTVDANCRYLIDNIREEVPHGVGRMVVPYGGEQPGWVYTIYPASKHVAQR
jgi:hypothetical protein